MGTLEWLNKIIIKKEVVDYHFEDKLLYIECINKNSIAEEILDAIKEHLGENYRYGIKTYNKYWNDNSRNEDLVVYAKEKE